MGADLGEVRIHADASADALSRLLSARAVTAGKDIYLRRDAFQPGATRGKELLAHEVAHTIQQSQSCAVPDIQRAADIPSVDEIEFGLESILGPKPESATFSATDEQWLELYRYLKSLRRQVAMSDPAFEQSVQMLLEGWFPGEGKQVWDRSRKPLAGYVGTAFGGQARKRQRVAEEEGLVPTREKRTKKRLTGTDVVFFSGHHYARLGDPGEFDAIDLRKVRFTSTHAKLLMISSCAGLDSGSLRILRRKFPNAYILAWRFGSPLNQKGLMRKFLERLPEDLVLEDPASIQEILQQWREYVESLASDPKTVSPNGLGYATPDGTVTFYAKRKGGWIWVTK
ncbi:MAG: DUF4157 domain-containing protein [Anaerolineae bacterium]|nr:DUF4157 domain-containing protein [Anaerolineae bacterium]